MKQKTIIHIFYQFGVFQFARDAKQGGCKDSKRHVVRTKTKWVNVSEIRCFKSECNIDSNNQ